MYTETIKETKQKRYSFFENIFLFLVQVVQQVIDTKSGM